MRLIAPKHTKNQGFFQCVIFFTIPSYFNDLEEVVKITGRIAPEVKKAYT